MKMKREIRGSWFMLRGSWLVACGSWIVACLAALPLLGAPMVSDVTVTGSGSYFPTATVEYKLTGAPAVVTFELQTNGVPVNCNYRTVEGQINQLLQPSAGTYSFTWAAATDWPNQRAKNAQIVVKAWSTNAPPDYMIVPLVKGSTDPVRYYAKVGDVPNGITDIAYKTTHLAMRRIHARESVRWEMGGRSTDSGVSSNEGLHLAALTEDFYIGVYTITLAQYKQTEPSGRSVYNALGKSEAAKTYTSDTTDYGRTRPAAGPCPKYYMIGSAASYRWPANREALNVTSAWYFDLLRTRTGIKRFYLPTSAQWEFACRAGTTTKFNNGTASIGTTGWCTTNNTDDPDYPADGFPHAVGLRDPNAWGLYDMHGNVYEWCCDCSSPSLEATSDGTPLVDPPGPGNSDSWRLRGGAFDSAEIDCGSFDVYAADFGSQTANKGFRVTCPAIAVK